MAIDKDLLEILACPESKQPVSLAADDLVARLNQAIREQKIKNRDGTLVTEEIDAGLVREDGQVLYPIRDEIPTMLVAEGIELDQL